MMYKAYITVKRDSTSSLIKLQQAQVAGQGLHIILNNYERLSCKLDTTNNKITFSAQNISKFCSEIIR